MGFEPKDIGILGLAAALPSGQLTNEDLELRFNPKELNRICKMTGIRKRRVVRPGQYASDLALTAADRLLRHKNFDRSLIDLVVFVSQTPDYLIPATASVLHAKLGLEQHCATFDLNQSCSAYPYALSVAYSMIAAGVAQHALILNADAITTLVHPEDRSLVPLHGDGACATLVGRCAPGYGIQGFSLGTDGSGAKCLLVPERASRNGWTAGEFSYPEFLNMDGPAVFHFSVTRVPREIKQALERFGLTMDDIDSVILHQANRTMMELIYKGAGVPREKQFYCLEETGNSGGAATAVALAEAWRGGCIRPGSRTLVCSYGAGLTWGTCVIRWPEDADPVAPSDPVIPDEELLSASL